MQLYGRADNPGAVCKIGKIGIARFLVLLAKDRRLVDVDVVKATKL